MSRRANGRDSAPMESFFASPKEEVVHDEGYATRAEARASLFASVEVFSNRVRRHSPLGYRPPSEYERAGSPLNPTLAIRGEAQPTVPLSERLRVTHRRARKCSGPA